MTAYQDSFDFTAKGGFSMSSAEAGSFEVTAKGAFSMSSGIGDDLYEITAKGGFSMSSAEASLFEFTAKGLLEEASDDMSFGAAGALSMEDVFGFDLDGYPVDTITISKTIQETLWNCVVKMDGLVDTPDWEKEFAVHALDHNDVNRLLFGGFIPQKNLAHACVANETVLSGWDHGFYLSAQRIPAGLLHIDEETNPKDIIEALLSQSGTPINTVTETLDDDLYAAQCLRRWGSDYDSVHDGANGDIIDGEVYAGQSAPPSYWFVFKNVVAFDTSRIGIGGRVESAKLLFHIKNKIDFDDADTLVLQNGQPDNPHIPLAVGDFSKTLMSGNGGEIAGSEILIDKWIQIELNEEGLSWINETGITKLYVRTQRDIDKTTPSGYENIEFYPDGARLVLTYFQQGIPNWYWTTGIEPYNIKSVAKWVEPSDIAFTTDLYATKCLRRWGDGYEWLHDGSSGDIVTGEVYAGQSAPPSYYFLFRNPVGFDTSALGLGSKIVSAKLKIYVIDKDTDFEDTDKLVIQNGQPDNPHIPLEGGDYDKEEMAGNGGEISGADISDASWIEIELSSEGISWINRNGNTKLYLRTQKDIDFVEPTGYELLEFSTDGAQLEVTYYPEGDIPKKAFVWDPERTKYDAINEICEYCDFLFIVKPRENPEGPVPISSGYFIPASEIDTELDLPAMVTITKDTTDTELISIPRADNKYAERINRVIVRGTDPMTGNWYISTKESAEVTAQAERPIEFYLEDPDLVTQGLTDAKADSLFGFFSSAPDTYNAKFQLRFDLQLYQKIKFVGFDKIPEEEMRITEITYSLSKLTKEVEIGFTLDKRLSDLKALEKSMSADFVTEVTNIIKKEKQKDPKLAVGTVTEIDGNAATVQMEKDSGYVKARLINQED